MLLTQFKYPRMFTSLMADKGPKSPERTVLRYLAERCQSNYPADLFLAQRWSVQLLYPHLPSAVLDQLPSKLSTLSYSHHTTLVETERRFVLTPEFGVTDPPLVAANKAREIYYALINAKNGGAVDKSAIHVPAYANDEGKPPIVVRGTQLWPAEAGTDYRYDDLRCAYNFAKDILLTFGEPRDAPMTTQSLKLRHLMAWLPGGYNSFVGATLEGVFKALKDVVQAYGANKSEDMRPPLPSS